MTVLWTTACALRAVLDLCALVLHLTVGPACSVLLVDILEPLRPGRARHHTS